MKKVFILTSIIMGALFFVSPDLTSTLGISAYASKKIIDIISTASSLAAIVGIIAAVAGGGAIGVGILATAKALAKKYGAAYAAAW